MSHNTPNSGSIAQLQMNETLLVSARKVAGQKVQLEFAEIIEKGSAPANVLASFNKSDNRFSQGGARRAWMTAEPSDASKLLGVDLSDSADWTVNALGQEVLMLNVLNPQILIGDELKNLKVEVVETTTANEWQLDNIDTAAKRKGKDGDFIMCDGKHIFANTRIALGKANHVFLTPDTATAETIVTSDQVFS